MKIKAIAMSIAFGLAVSTANAGIPVIDGVSNAQRALEFIQNIAQLKMQYEQMELQYKAIIGNRDVGALFNNPALQQYLPKGMQGLYNDIKNNNVDGIANKMADMAKHYENSKTMGTNAVGIAQQQKENAMRNRIMLDQIFDSSQQRLNQLDALMKSVDGATDQKAAIDLQNRIQTEVGLLQAEQSKIQLVKMLADADDKLLQQQQRTAIQEYNRSTGKSTTKTVAHRF